MVMEIMEPCNRQQIRLLAGFDILLNTVSLLVMSTLFLTVTTAEPSTFRADWNEMMLIQFYLLAAAIISSGQIFASWKLLHATTFLLESAPRVTTWLARFWRNISLCSISSWTIGLLLLTALDEHWGWMGVVIGGILLRGGMILKVTKFIRGLEAAGREVLMELINGSYPAAADGRDDVEQGVGSTTV